MTAPPDSRPTRGGLLRSPAVSEQVALVTGGAIRVGAGIVRGLVEAGWRVWIHYNRSAAPAEALARDLNSKGSSRVLGTVRADLCDEEARRELVSDITDPRGPAGGEIDLLVNSAASFEHGAFRDRSDAELRRVLETNLVAPLSLTRGLLDPLTRRRGSVVNIVDLSADHPWRGYLDHAVAKAGLQVATRALAAELAPVRCNAVAPGTVLLPDDPKFGPGTPARAHLTDQIPLGTLGSPRDVAAAVLFLATAPHVNGVTLPVDGGRRAAMAGGYE